jgi:hypothetical protein
MTIVFINIIIIIIIIIITTHISIITSHPNPKSQHQQRHLPGPYSHTVAAKHRLNFARTFQTSVLSALYHKIFVDVFPEHSKQKWTLI